jgi:hypothetical protein
MQDCRQLVAYRDGDLLRQWDVAIAKLRYNREAKDMIAELREELLRDAKWANTEIAGVVGVVALNIKTVADLIGDLLGFVPATGALANAGRAIGPFTMKTVLNGIEAGKKIDTIASEGAEIGAYKFLLAELNPVTRSVGLAWNLADNLQKMVTFPEDHRQMRKDIRDAVDRMDRAMLDFDGKMENASQELEFLNAVKGAIDARCG